MDFPRSSLSNIALQVFNDVFRHKKWFQEIEADRDCPAFRESIVYQCALTPLWVMTPVANFHSIHSTYIDCANKAIYRQREKIL